MADSAWPFIEYSAWCMGEPDGDALRVWMPGHLTPLEALTFGRREIDGADAMLDHVSYCLRLNGKQRWRESSTVENKIDGRAEDESIMVPAKRSGHEYWRVDVIPMRLTAANPDTSKEQG